MKTKIRIKDIYYLLLFLWAFSDTVAMSSFNRGTSYIYNVRNIVWLITRLFIVLKVLLESRYYKPRDFLVLFLLAFVGYFSTVNSGSTFLEAGFWFIAGGRGVDWDTGIKRLFKGEVFAMVFIISMCAIGISADKTKNGNIGHSFGYYHPNDLALHILQIFLMYVYLHKNANKTKLGYVSLVVASVTYLITKSKTVLFVLLFVGVVLFFFDMRKNKSRISNFLSKRFSSIMKYAFIFLTASSIFLSANGKLSFSIFGNLHGRLPLMAIYFSYYKILPWGQPLLNHNSANYDWHTKLYTLDNSYLHLLLGFGAVTFILFIIVYLLMIKKAYKEKDTYLFLILVTYAILGFSETALIRARYNFTILLFSQLVWCSSIEKNRRV